MDGGGGETLEFEYTTGLTAQLDVDVEWSEPRDTTLLLWIGLDTSTSEGEGACDPAYTDSIGSGGGSGFAFRKSDPPGVGWEPWQRMTRALTRPVNRKDRSSKSD